MTGVSCGGDPSLSTSTSWAHAGASSRVIDEAEATGSVFRGVEVRRVLRALDVEAVSVSDVCRDIDTRRCGLVGDISEQLICE